MAGLVLIALAAFFVEHRGIVARLGKAVDTVAASNYLYDLSARIEGSGLTVRRVILLSGVGDETRQKEIGSLIGAIRGIHAVRWEAGEQIAPVVWHARWDGRRIALNGGVVGADWGAEVENTARRLFPSATVTNDMRIVAGKPAPKWPRAATVALEQLASLETGDAEISGTVVTVLGVATTAQTRADIDRTLDVGLPNGYTGRAIVSLPDAPAQPSRLDGSLRISVDVTKPQQDSGKGRQRP